MSNFSGGFGESVRQSAFSASVDFPRGYMRKYWSLKRETLTVRCLSTEAHETDRNKFRNEIRAFLYKTPDDLLDVISDVYREYSTVRELIRVKVDQEKLLTEEEKKDLNLNSQISVQVRAYEKELFYLKCLSLNLALGSPQNSIKPQLVLRALARLSLNGERDAVFTAPEFLFALLGFHECERPVYEKDVFKKDRKR
ncbi:hypothetical protein CEE45_01735 [Candidatus Heimdallarchaeota archaeon B3_Heim]|nr:MAG: hypothetical protein CEE45_01735 [Candidatus Heimdallarchaeota archaeon B3_Heim]